MSTRPVRQRVCARLLPVNAAGEVLLLHGCDPMTPETTYWFSIGGAMERGERLEDAAVREMREETGISVDVADLTPAIGREDVAFDWGPWHLVQDQTFFAVPLEDAEVSFAHLEPLEVGTIDDAAWWTPDALDADGTAANDALTDMMRAAVRAVRAGQREGGAG